MKHTIFINRLFIFVLAGSLIACGGTSTQEDSASLGEAADSETATCLAEYAKNNELEKMISKEQIAEIVGKTAAELEYDEGKSSSSRYSTVGYSWKSDEQRILTMETKVGDRIIKTEAPLDDQIDFGNIDILDEDNAKALEYFERTYGNKSKAAKERAKESLDRTAESRDDVTKEQAESLKKMVDKESSVKVEGVGSSAYYGIIDANGMVYIDLKVLDGNTMFKITTDVSSDSDKDLEIAKKVAQQIIANCNN
jgi:hypothetical protein